MKFLNLFSLLSTIFLSVFVIIKTPKEYTEFTDEPLSVPEEYSLNTEISSYSPDLNSSYMVTYFSNLKENMAYNFGSSCVFVALSSVLSYYDSWYNDDFIPEYFDVNSTSTSLSTALSTSPGIKIVDTKFSTTSVTYCDALYSIVTNKYNDFSCYLMWYSYNNLNTESKTIGNLSTKNIQKLLDYVYGIGYINLISVGLKENYNEDYSVTQTEKINFIKNCIDSGKPCIVSISDPEEYEGEPHARHAVVAYDYDDEHIYANFGWKSSNTYLHYPLLNKPIRNNTYSIINYAIAFDIDSTFRPYSNNYVVYESGVYNYYSYNGLLGDASAIHQHPIGHPQNSNTHSYACPTCHFLVKIEHTNINFTSVGNINHNKKCSSSSCSSITEKHKFTYVKKTGYHKEVCVECGYTQNTAHTFGQYTFYNLETTDDSSDTITQVRCIYCSQLQS